MSRSAKAFALHQQAFALPIALTIALLGTGVASAQTPNPMN